MSRPFAPLAATVVGSFPAKPAMKMMAASYRDGSDPFVASLEGSVKAQLGAGIDIVSDGQTRDTMVNLFAKGLRGVRMRERPAVVREIEWISPITLEDQKHAKSLLPPEKKLKGIITGPFTMAKGLEDKFYGSAENMAFALAEAMNKEARSLEPFVDVIQFDEPFFSVEWPEFAQVLVETARRGLSKPVALHVCGDVAPIFDKLTELPVDLLDHEFAAHPELLATVADVSFRQSLGFGCVRSDKNEVDRLGDVVSLVREAIDRLGAERMLLDPDCGLRHLDEPVARAKLETVVRARNEVLAMLR
ncbi:MAG: methionine synthase [Methanobacteriota archaeon]